MRELVGRLRQQPRLMFLIDGIGATVSASCLGVILTALEAYVGMPRTVLSLLALVALAYGAYSIGCYYLLRQEWRRCLRAISWLNLAYCGVTAGLVAVFRARLTFVGAADTSLAEGRTNHQASSVNGAPPR